MDNGTQADVISMTKFRARADRAKWRRKYGRHQAAIEMGASEEGALKSVYDFEAYDAEQRETVKRLWHVVGWLLFCITFWVIGSLVIMSYLP